MPIRFGMVVLYVRDLEKSLAFYRLLGLDLPEPGDGRPGILHKLTPDVTLVITTDEVARRLDAGWTRPERGYQQQLEFFVDDDAAVDALWERMTAVGHRGVSAPGHLLQPYATVVEDPDGNTVLITHEPAGEGER